MWEFTLYTTEGHGQFWKTHEISNNPELKCHKFFSGKAAQERIIILKMFSDLIMTKYIKLCLEGRTIKVIQVDKIWDKYGVCTGSW